MRMNSVENKTRFMKSMVHDCQVGHSYWNYTSYSKVGGQLMLNLDWPPIDTEAV